MPTSNPEVNEVIDRLQSNCPITRAEAATRVQHIMMGPVREPAVNRLLGVLSKRLEIDDEDGTPLDPSEHVRERAVYAVHIALEIGHNVGEHPIMRLIETAAEKDPHEWVKTAARETLEKHKRTNFMALRAKVGTARVEPKMQRTMNKIG